MNSEDCLLEESFISSVLPNGDQEKIKTLVCTEQQQQQQQQQTNITAAHAFIPSANSKLKKSLA